MRYSRLFESTCVGMYLFFLTLWRTLLVIAVSVAAPFERRRSLKGGLLILLGLPLFLLWQLLHWIGYLADEIFFRAYRRVEVREPLFVIGPPRTGTTHLHHVLSRDRKRTSFRTWECLFGLSVSARYLILGCMRLHRALGSPFRRIANRLRGGLFARMEDIHPVRLDDPEEDFLALLPVMACFLLLIPLPSARWLLPIARCDSELSRREQQALMGYYRKAIQKHLYVFGKSGQGFLSKNASFPGAVGALLREFPDAKILATVRDPQSVVPSQLSSLRPALETCGFETIPPRLLNDLLALLPYYYMNLKKVAAAFPGQLAFIDNAAMRQDLTGTLSDALEELGLQPSPELLAGMRTSAADTGTKASGHQYTLEEFGLSETVIRSRFAAVYTAYTFGEAAARPRDKV
ncbi:MAG: sulfotransferase [Pseudomonadota bacterium]